MATLVMRAASTDGGSADMKRRSRKGKNAQKKQPQRGLGVAQLEKLRLQEQSPSLSPWQDSESRSSVSGYFPDIGAYPENGLVFKPRSSPSMGKESCSSASGSANYLSLNRKRCLNDSGSPSVAGKESISSSNFLSLGLSSSSYAGDGWPDASAEESSQDTLMSRNIDATRLKRSVANGREGNGEGSQLRASIWNQDLSAVDLERHTSLRTCPSENILSSQPFWLSSLPSFSNITPGNRPLKSARIGEEEILDLRLKLAL